MKNYAQCEDIRGDRGLPAVPKLGRHVIGRSAGLSGLYSPLRSLQRASQTEVRDHGSDRSTRIGAEDDVAALEVAVDHVFAMRFRQARAELPRDRTRILFRQRRATEPVGKRLAVEKLHGNKIDGPVLRGGRMDLEDFAYIGMADLAGVPHFRRQPLAEACLGALNGNTPLEFVVPSFIDDAHTSLCHLAHNPESSVENRSWLEMMLGPNRFQ